MRLHLDDSEVFDDDDEEDKIDLCIVETYGWVHLTSRNMHIADVTAHFLVHLWEKSPHLGKPRFTKSDEFPENFRTALDPPPRPFFGKKCCDFFPNRTKPHQICNEIFQIGNDPPPFLTFFRKIMTKIGV